MSIACDDRWITVKPNGKYNEGRPVKLGDGGEIKAGMGGKFNGQKISEICQRGKKTQQSEASRPESEAIKQFRRDAPRLSAESLAKKQAEHEEFINYTPKKQARLKLRKFLKRFQDASIIDKDYSFDPVDSKTLDKFADFLTRRLKYINNPQQLSNTRIFDALLDYGDFKKDEREQLLSGGLIKEANTRRDRDYQYTKAAKLLASALYADPPDFSKVNAKAAEREKKREEAKKAKEISKLVGRTYLNVPYPERWIAKQHGARWDKDVKKWYLTEGKEMHENLKKYAGDERLAMDKSMRSYDGNGHLIVERTIITKASVNPYFGREVPNYESLGLEPDKIYNLLRDPKELEKALSSFKGVQLLIKHTPVSADDPHNDLTVGSIGTDVDMEGNDVYASLRVFDKDAIELIESGKLQELSAGYAYTADMTPGEFNGQGYDGVMRNIHGNHVALVERGRIGRDAIISDSFPIKLMESSMKLKKGAIEAVEAKLRPIVAMDGDITPDIVEGVIKTVADNMLPQSPGAKDEDVTEVPKDDDEVGKTAGDEEPTDEAKKAGDEEPTDEAKKAGDEEPGDGEKNKPAMDADAIEAAAVARINALWQAREDVKPLVGVVAMDSAEAVYKYALQQKGVNTKGVHPSAYKSMVDLINKQSKPAAMAMDTAIFGEPDKLTARFR